MNALNSSSPSLVAPAGSVVHINDLPRLHKPDEPPSALVGGSIGAVFLPSHAGHVAAAAAADVAAMTGPSVVSAITSPPSSNGSIPLAADVPLTVSAGGAVASADVGSHTPSDAAATAALLSNSTAAAAMLNRLLSVSAQLTHQSGGGGAAPPGGTTGSSGGSTTNSSTSHKQCPYHRLCSRGHHHLHQHHLHQQQQAATAAAAAAAASTTNVQGHPYAAAWNHRYGRSGGGSSMVYAQRDAISTNVSPPPLNAVILADRYLMMEPVEGNNLYRCCDIKSHEELVCKIANNPCSNLLTAHFRLEGHAHVNPLHKVIQGNNKSYLLFSPSEGDLHSYVRVRKRLREPEARRLCRQMCEVVKSCHEQGIVLRDLKLRKFVFADRERTHLKLESLEDAVVLDDPSEDLLQDKRGCPAYVSPEILRANTTYSGKAADMWSLGVILYTMLVGRYPFNDSEHASLFAKISRGQFTVPECLSSKARCMIRALLRRDPEERIASEDVLFHPWLLHDDTKDHAYGGGQSSGSGGGSGSSRSGGHSSSSSNTADDHCVPEWFDPSDEADSSAASSRTTTQYISSSRDHHGYDS